MDTNPVYIVSKEILVLLSANELKYASECLVNELFYIYNVFVLLGDKELIQEVLFDAVVTAPLEAYWTSLVLNKSE